MSQGIQSTQDTQEKFLEYLELKQLSDVTKNIYLYHYNKFKDAVNQYGINQDLVNAYILSHNGSSPSRAFLKNYFEFTKDRRFDLIKVKGRKKKRKINHINTSDLLKIIEWLNNNSRTANYALMVMLTYYCGLRYSEVKGIKINDFNLADWKDDNTKGIRLKIYGKGSKERHVVVPPFVMKSLKPFMLERLEEMKDADEELLFANTARLRHKWKQACLAICDKAYRFHELRHTRSYDWYKEGKDIIQIKTRLGHSSIATTQLYINPEEEEEIDTWVEENSEK